MKRLDFHWKLITPYYLIVRRKIPNTSKYAFMTLQLYQIDYKSFLLDFANKIPSKSSHKTQPSNQISKVSSEEKVAKGVAGSSKDKIESLTAEEVEKLTNRDEKSIPSSKQGLVITSVATSWKFEPVNS